MKSFFIFCFSLFGALFFAFRQGYHYGEMGKFLKSYSHSDFKHNPNYNPMKNDNQHKIAQDTGYVRSADGTQIGYRKVGSGPVPLVIVHGAYNSSKQWLPVARALANTCTCYVMDRRGRPLSGGFGSNYTFYKEAEDIKAVLDAAGPNACLMGHSSGAIYALEAAREFPVKKLILYEPPLHYNGHFREAVWPKLVELHGEGKYKELATTFFKEEIGLPDEALKGLQATPLWDRMVALAPTFVPEWEATHKAAPTVERYKDISTPTLLLSGTLTANHPSMATKDLEALLPNVQKRMLEGQGHGANLEAPEMVAREVAHFLVATN